jgi:hypothetical protein
VDVIIRLSRKYVIGATYRGVTGNRSGPSGWLNPRDGRMNILNEII